MVDYDYTGKIVYINGNLYKVTKTYEGDVDLSYHGSPYYETFIEAENLETGEIKVFGDQSYNWCAVKKYIKNLEDKIEKIKNILG